MSDFWMQREAQRRQVAENSARLAFAWAVATTTGQGSMAFDKVLDFGLAFAERPMVSYGFIINNRTDFEDDNDGSNPIVPISSGSVYEWVQDGRGLYIGAYGCVNVICDDVIELEHHFGFSGLAIKDIGSGWNPTD